MAESKKGNVPDQTPGGTDKKVAGKSKEQLPKDDGKAAQNVQNTETPECMEVLMKDLQCLNWLECKMLEQKLAKDETKDPNEIRLLQDMRQKQEELLREDPDTPVLVQVQQDPEETESSILERQVLEDIKDLWSLDSEEDN
ncbi:hypothetical protein O0L34_g2289 [Tuta absoluta]|nr:hypothetical protein O0L34_g2289 [Tuta absoluta]